MLSMAPIAPNTSASDLQGLQALLVLIADPEAAHARLRALQEAADKHQELLKQVQLSQVQADAATKQRQEQEAAMETLRREAKDTADRLKAKATVLGLKEAALNGRERSVVERERKLDVAAADHAEQVATATSALAAREKQLAVNCTAHEEAVRLLVQRQAEFDRLLTPFRGV
jgi:hypothetical protein